MDSSESGSDDDPAVRRRRRVRAAQKKKVVEAEQKAPPTPEAMERLRALLLPVRLRVNILSGLNHNLTRVRETRALGEAAV